MTTDKERLDWLEHMAREPGGILLHAEIKSTGRLGLGLARPNRPLREAIDSAIAGRPLGKTGEQK